MRSDEVAHDAEVQTLLKRTVPFPVAEIVDVAEIGTRVFTLPREVFWYLTYQEKSAEVIVVGETSRDCEYHTPEDSQNSEGPNIELRPNSGQNVVLRRDSFPLSGQGPNKYDRKSTTTEKPVPCLSQSGR
jgi:hypothetical protein